MTVTEPSEDGPVDSFAEAGTARLSAAAVPDALDAVAVPLAEARMLDASSGEIVAVEIDDEAVSVLLPSEPDEPEEDEVELELELELVSVPETASKPIASGVLSRKAMVGPATMSPRKRSRALLLSGCESFVT